MSDEETLEAIDRKTLPAKERVALEESKLIIEDQREKIERLRAQAERLQTIKYGILIFIFSIGLSSGVQATNVSTIEIMTSLVWFLLTGVTIILGSAYMRSLSNIFKPYSFGEVSLPEENDKLLTRLLDMEHYEIAEIRAQRIMNNREKIRELESKLRRSHIILGFMILALVLFGLPPTSVIGWYFL